MLNPAQMGIGLQVMMRSTQSQEVSSDLSFDSESQSKQTQAAFYHMVKGYIPIRVKEIKKKKSDIYQSIG